MGTFTLRLADEETEASKGEARTGTGIELPQVRLSAQVPAHIEDSKYEPFLIVHDA